MFISIGLYCYAFLSTHWNFIDNNLIKNKQQEYLRLNNNHNHSIQLKTQIRYAFRSRYGLFGYCLDYKWLNLFMIKSKNTSHDEPKSNLTIPCNQSSIMCQERKLCVCLNLIKSFFSKFQLFSGEKM